MYFVKTPGYLKHIYPSLVWDIKKENTLYLTFDDGPLPFITDEVLRMLGDFNAKATFFCLGDHVKEHGKLFDKITMEGHAVGNHTWHHLNGWKTKNEHYYEDIEQCAGLVSASLFRPPYGRIGYAQIQHLKNRYKIIMWDVLSGDFDLKTDAATCARNVIENAEAGSIIVFHDSEKAKEKMLSSLPLVLDHFSKKGFLFDKIAF